MGFFRKIPDLLIADLVVLAWIITKPFEMLNLNNPNIWNICHDVRNIVLGIMLFSFFIAEPADMITATLPSETRKKWNRIKTTVFISFAILIFMKRSLMDSPLQYVFVADYIVLVISFMISIPIQWSFFIKRMNDRKH